MQGSSRKKDGQWQEQSIENRIESWRPCQRSLPGIQGSTTLSCVNEGGGKRERETARAQEPYRVEA